MVEEKVTGEESMVKQFGDLYGSLCRARANALLSGGNPMLANEANKCGIAIRMPNDYWLEKLQSLEAKITSELEAKIEAKIKAEYQLIPKKKKK